MPSSPRRASAALVVALVAAVVSACGGQAATPPGRSASAVPTAHGAPILILRTRLSGRAVPDPGAPPDASGDAIIALHRGDEVCFRFAHLHGFHQATRAILGMGAARRSGVTRVVLTPGPQLHHQGCVSVPAGVAATMTTHATGLFVTIFSVHSPSGAVRGQL